MNKSYMLVICLLAASFTGCLGSDDIVDEVPVEEETIEPVGMEDNDGNGTNNYYYNNDTYYVNGTDYLELISQVENLTVSVEELTTEVKELTEVLEEMQSSKYDVPENSTYTLYNYHDASLAEYEIIKSGNVVTVNYIGPYHAPPQRWSYNDTSPVNCTDVTYQFRFENADGLTIASYSNDVPSYRGREEVQVLMECDSLVTIDGSGGPESYSIWSSMIITLPEEPVRVYFSNPEKSFTFS